MIKFFMRRTIYKKFDRESQDMLLQLVKNQHIIEFCCSMFWKIMYILPFIPLFIIICEDVELSMITQLAIISSMLSCFIGLLAFMRIFREAMLVFSQLLAEKIYFLVCTTKGNALCKNDFKTIEQINEKLYAFIATQMCRGYCYAICFEICKTLKKGALEFIAIKKYSPCSEEEDDGKGFTMHVLYINNGWAFDTYSSRQYPIEKLHEIYRAKIYKKFSFDEISDKSYEEFRDEQEPELAKWSLANDCSLFWKED